MNDVAPQAALEGLLMCERHWQACIKFLLAGQRLGVALNVRGRELRRGQRLHAIRETTFAEQRVEREVVVRKRSAAEQAEGKGTSTHLGQG